jgi:hypothetical protein
MAENPSIARFPMPDWFAALSQALDDDEELAVIGRWCTLDFALKIDDDIVFIQLLEGKIANVRYNPDINASWSFTLQGTHKDWQMFLQPLPPPFYTDLLAMNSRVASFSIDGDRHIFVRHLRAIGRIFQIAQQLTISV